MKAMICRAFDILCYFVMINVGVAWVYGYDSLQAFWGLP